MVPEPCASVGSAGVQEVEELGSGQGLGRVQLWIA